MPRKLPTPAPKRGPRKPLPEELARDAIAHEDVTREGKVKMTFRVVLHVEALAARAVREEKNLDTLVTEILEAAAKKGQT